MLTVKLILLSACSKEKFIWKTGRNCCFMTLLFVHVCILTIFESRKNYEKSSNAMWQQQFKQQKFSSKIFQYFWKLQNYLSRNQKNRLWTQILWRKYCWCTASALHKPLWWWNRQLSIYQLHENWSQLLDARIKSIEFKGESC